MLRKETYLSAEEAVEKGFADRVAAREEKTEAQVAAKLLQPGERPCAAVIAARARMWEGGGGAAEAHDGDARARAQAYAEAMRCL